LAEVFVVNHCVAKAYLRNDSAAMRVLYLLLMMLFCVCVTFMLWLY